MADLSKIRLNNTNYNLKDAVAREGLTAIQNSLETLHEPEDDEDVDDMLESLDLTVIDDDNLVGSAEIGSGNVVNWNPAKQVSGGGNSYTITPLLISYDVDTSTGTIPLTWQEIYDITQTQLIFVSFGTNLTPTFSVIPHDGAKIREEDKYVVYVIGMNILGDTNIATFTCASPDEYPQFVDD